MNRFVDYVFAVFISVLLIGFTTGVAAMVYLTWCLISGKTP